MTQPMHKGFSFKSKGMMMTATKGKTVLKFDQEHCINSNACLIGIQIVPILKETALPSVPEGEKMNINKMHLLFGHTHTQDVRCSAKYYGWELAGPMKTCMDCAIGKSQQK